MNLVYTQTTVRTTVPSLIELILYRLIIKFTWYFCKAIFRFLFGKHHRIKNIY